MAKTFKYDLESLEWDEDHRRNKEGTYCYCGMDYNSGDPMLRCESCEQLFHWDCVSCLKMKPLLGDTFYRFKCSVCAGGSGEEYERETLSWVQVIYLVLYHLIQAEPERKYFRWRENICATINEHWRSLFPGKTKTATWQNTVAGSLSTHSVLFKSGFEDTQQTGNWTLQEAVEPAKAPFKGPTRATGRAAPKRDRPAKKRPRPTGPAAEEILEVLAEGKLDSVKRRGGSRHRVSFSDDEDNEGGSVRRPRAKRSRALENDAELLQSFELFTQLERQRLGDSPDTATKKPDTAAENPDVATKNPDATSTEDGSVRDATVPVSADIAGTSAPANSEVAEGFDAFDDCSSLSSMPSGDEDSPPTTGDTAVTAADIGSRADCCSAGQSPAAMDEGRRPGAYSGTVEKSHTELAGISPRVLFAEDRRWGMAGAVKLMSEREQWDVSERIGASRVAMASAAARRVRRRVHLRRLKRMLGLPIFDIDRAVAQAMARQLEPWHPARDGGEDDDEDDDGGVTRTSLLVGETGASTAVAETLRRPGDTAVSEPAGTAPGAQQLSVPEATGDGGPSVVRVTAYANSFASRLLGRAALRDSLTAAGVRISPFHGRLLRPFIWRDTKPMGGAHDQQRRPAMAMLRVLRAIRGRQHRVFAAGTVEAPMAQPDRETIDYVHFQPRHVEQANALLCRTFWPGIDISEALQYPEFSIVALYRRRVVGCAFLTPDAYLTYIAVAAGWEGAGIARYMVYHLTQTVPTKDVTLHVAATNVAMLLYQQLGFKPETYTPGFYRAYLPETSRTCPNAFFMRLRREP